MFLFCAALVRCTDACKTCLHLYRKPLLVNICCLLFLILYSTLGGLVFLHFERPYAEHLKGLERLAKAKCVLMQMDLQPASSSSTGELSDSLNATASMGSHQSHPKRRRKQLESINHRPLYSTVPAFLMAERISNRCVLDQKYDERVEWNLKNSALFGFGILTTLGYGRIEPQTTNGRLFTVAYGFLGVPFTVIIFTNFGRYIQNLERLIRRRLCGKKPKADGVSLVDGTRKESFLPPGDKGRRRSSPSIFKMGLGHGVGWRRVSALSIARSVSPTLGGGDEEVDEEADQIAPTTLMAIVIFYLLLGATLMSRLNAEEIDFFNGIYFAFLCLTAIEYGKLIPSNSWYLPFVILYICFGLAISTIALDIGSTYVRRLYFIGKKMKNIPNVKIWFGSKNLRVRDLLAALGHNIGLEPAVLCDLDLEQLVENAIQVKEGRISRVPQTHMIMDDIWPPELIPLFLKDGGPFPTFVDADEARLSLASRLPRRERPGDVRRRYSGPAPNLRRSVSALSSSSGYTLTLKQPQPAEMESQNGPRKQSVRFEDLLHSKELYSARENVAFVGDSLPPDPLDDTTSGISLGSASLANFPQPPPLPIEVPPTLPLSPPPASVCSSIEDAHHGPPGVCGKPPPRRREDIRIVASFHS